MLKCRYLIKIQTLLQCKTLKSTHSFTEANTTTCEEKTKIIVYNEALIVTKRFTQFLNDQLVLILFVAHLFSIGTQFINSNKMDNRLHVINIV